MKTSIGDHTDEFYFENSYLRLWERRHFQISQLLVNNRSSKVLNK